jgi:threonine/homoserine/homoserine lactone efflux protein
MMINVGILLWAVFIICILGIAFLIYLGNRSMEGDGRGDDEEEE